MGPRDRFYPYLYHGDYIGLLGTGFMQVFHLGRAPRTKETLPDFLKWRRVTRHLLVFRGLTGSQRTPGFGASHIFKKAMSLKLMQHIIVDNLCDSSFTSPMNPNHTHFF